MTKSIKKMTALVMTFFMVFSVVVLPGFHFSVKADAASGKNFDLIEITDFHGALLSSYNEQIAAVLAKDIKTVEASNPDRTLVMGGGDLYQGTPISNVLQGVPVQQAMSSIGMEVTAVGNHEFDWTLDTINTKTMVNANYSMVCANLFNKADGSLVYPAYKVITKDGVRIAVIGGITTDTPNIVMPANVANYTFGDPATEINKVAASIKANKAADVIVADIHEGSDKDYATTGPIVNIAKKLVGVDAVFGGHSHTIMSTTVTTDAGATVPVEIASASGKGYIDLKMNVSDTGAISFLNAAGTGTSLDPATHTFGAYQAINFANTDPKTATFPFGYFNVTDNTYPGVDSAVYDIVQNANKDVAPIFNTVIGNLPTALNRNQDVQPSGESYLGNWSSDVVKNFTGADVGVANNGGLRCDFSAGDITKGMVFTFMPFDNEIDTVMVSGAQLKTMFENAFADNGKGIQVSGVKVAYNPKLASGSRVVSITKESDGTPIDMTSTTANIKVAGPDFVLTGGDGFTVFTDAAIKASLFDTHKLVRDALMDDVTKNGTITTTMDYRLQNVGPIEVLATSDNHGAVFDYDYASGKPTNAGLTRVSTFVKGQRTADGSGHVMVVDNGDTIQGTPLSYYFDKVDTTAEYPMMKAYGLIGYDTWTLGNHEFNYGLDVLNRVIADAQKENIHVLSANTYNTSDGSNFVGTYYVKSFDINGKTIKVGILGETTPAIPNWEDPSHYAGLTFQKNLVTETQKYVDQMKAAGCDVVILTVHSGQPGNAETIAEENQVTAIAEQTTGIDAIVAGHTHDVYADDLQPAASKPYIKTVRNNKDGKPVHITEPKNGATYVSEIDISLNADGTLNTNNLISTKAVSMANVADDATFEAAMKSYQDETLGYVNTVIGKSTGAFTGDGQLTRPTAIMDLINQVQENYLKEGLVATNQPTDNMLSIAAPLSNSAYIPQGDVSIKDIMSVYVFENYLYGIKMTGAQIKAWMEWSARYYQQAASNSDPIEKDPVLNVPDYNLDVLYGATYQIDRTKPVGQRIVNLEVNGVPVKDTDVFTVAINNYRYNGGGGFMDAAGLTTTDQNTGLKVPKDGITVYSSQSALGDDGQIRNMMINYIQDLTKNGKTLDPTLDSTWMAATSASMTINNPQTTLGLNSSEKLTATITPLGVASTNINWKSDNALVANVDANGVVTTGEISGDATITGTTSDGILTASVKIHVSNTTVETPAKVSVNRLAGDSRFDTSVEVANAYANGQKVDNVILASGLDFPDAISGGVLTNSLNAPMLLVGSAKSNAKAYDFIANNLADDGKVYILGGEAAISKDVSDYVQNTLKKTVVRIGGKNKFETNEQIIDTLKPAEGTPVIVASAATFADALSASSISAIYGYPVVLAQGDALSASAKNVISTVKPSNVYVLGGTVAISTKLVDAIKAADSSLTDSKITRIAGKDRYETSLKILNFFNLSTDKLIVASGNDFADALSGVALAAKEYAPVLLVNNNALNLSTISKYANVTVLGGTKAVTDDIKTLLDGTNVLPSYVQTSLKATVTVGAPATLPTYVVGVYTDGSIVPVSVTWNATTVDTSKAGTIVVRGIANDYNMPVVLTITVQGPKA